MVGSETTVRALMLWRFNRSWSSICASSWVYDDGGGEVQGVEGDDRAIFNQVRSSSILSLDNGVRVGSRSNDKIGTRRGIHTATSSPSTTLSTAYPYHPP